ncbi:hypothetical protein GLOTRDRAFT_140791 [Gloeophyllum trabeum ATCC 11539]|uniref:NYN domain-containing protein n=1 Tax=Gloeophyllum trabeum (strain ATCC 11539 / FP-39264 / Madison 617) TaxID=670483 RepID=S7RGW7_GLOTA|nr:uncharacterized protein GLOTRDRAFT_140791 [Gloeophyllum trabeum ATCC 11539]EPQ51809.1 hypothetical protein GLOTRDRAFT_140791 [Gloeophyllum trabeum ATCC 11539]
MFAYVFDNLGPITIVVVSGDPYISYALSILRLRGHQVVVIAPKGCGMPVEQTVDMFMDWESDILAKSQKLSNNPLHRTSSALPGRNGDATLSLGSKVRIKPPENEWDGSWILRLSLFPWVVCEVKTSDGTPNPGPSSVSAEGHSSPTVNSDGESARPDPPSPAFMHSELSSPRSVASIISQPQSQRSLPSPVDHPQEDVSPIPLEDIASVDHGSPDSSICSSQGTPVPPDYPLPSTLSDPSKPSVALQSSFPAVLPKPSIPPQPSFPTPPTSNAAGTTSPASSTPTPTVKAAQQFSIVSGQQTQPSSLSTLPTIVTRPSPEAISPKAVVASLAASASPKVSNPTPAKPSSPAPARTAQPVNNTEPVMQEQFKPLARHLEAARRRGNGFVSYTQAESSVWTDQAVKDAAGARTFDSYIQMAVQSGVVSVIGSAKYLALQKAWHGKVP